MINLKKGTSIISLVLCAVIISLVTAALVVTLNNTREYNLVKARQNELSVENSAYVRVYTKSEVEQVARQAFADNYLSFYDKEVDLEGFEALVMGDILNEIPKYELDKYIVTVTADGIDVENI